MKLSTALISAALAALATAAPSPHAFPWANANPQAYAAAVAYAEAYAEAEAIGHADPEAYALAASADDCASITCHIACGMMVLAAEDCNDGDAYVGPYAEGCLCENTITSFKLYYDSCMDCGWTLWKYYSGYLTAALSQCNAENTDYTATEPTGTSRCSTTLTDSYTIDTDINYSTYL